MTIPAWLETPRAAVALYYGATALGFLLLRVGLLFRRGKGRRNKDDAGMQDNLWILFTQGLNPVLAAALFPVFWPVVLLLQVFIRADFPGRIFGSNEARIAGTAFQKESSSGSLPEAGARGETMCDLHPSGRVEVAGKRFDAMAFRGFIPRGTCVRVTGANGFCLLVEEAEEKPGRQDGFS